MIDLTTFGASGVLANGGIVHRIDSQWATDEGTQAQGRGALRTFLTMDANGVEQGYNTNFRPVQFNESSDPAETRAFRLDRVPVVTVRRSPVPRVHPQRQSEHRFEKPLGR